MKLKLKIQNDKIFREEDERELIIVEDKEELL